MFSVFYLKTSVMKHVVWLISSWILFIICIWIKTVKYDTVTLI